MHCTRRAVIGAAAGSLFVNQAHAQQPDWLREHPAMSVWDAPARPAERLLNARIEPEQGARMTVSEWLGGRPTVLAVWTKPNRVHFYDMEKGSLIDDRLLPPAPNKPRSSDEWQEFTAKLTGPDYAYFLPLVRVAGTDIHVTDDGKLRLYHLSDDRLFMEVDDEEDEIKLVGGERLLTLDLDRALGTMAGLDEKLRLHVYQQNIRVGLPV